MIHQKLHYSNVKQGKKGKGGRKSEKNWKIYVCAMKKRAKTERKLENIRRREKDANKTK